MPLPYGSAGSLLGEYDIKKKSWERVIFEASSLELLAQAEVLQEAQTAIVQRTTRTMCVFAREGVLKLAANEAVANLDPKFGLRELVLLLILGMCSNHEGRPALSN